MFSFKYNTKEEAIQAVTKDGSELTYCVPALKNDEDVVMTALKQNSNVFFCASDELTKSKAFILKALNEGIDPWGLIRGSDHTMQADGEVMSLAIEKSHDGGVFHFGQGEVAISQELAAKALAKWRKKYGPSHNFDPMDYLHPTIKKWYSLILQAEKEAEMVAGGTKEEDEVVW